MKLVGNIILVVCVALVLIFNNDVAEAGVVSMRFNNPKHSALQCIDRCAFRTSECYLMCARVRVFSKDVCEKICFGDYLKCVRPCPSFR